jgi:hypothetical protein
MAARGTTLREENTVKYWSSLDVKKEWQKRHGENKWINAQQEESVVRETKIWKGFGIIENYAG